jgi:hypothetical protein
MRPIVEDEVIPINVPPERMRPRGIHKDLTDSEAHLVSWMYAPDVITAIDAVLAAGERTFGEVFNFAHTEETSVRDTADMVQQVYSGDDTARAKVDTTAEGALPYVDSGRVDTSKAMEVLGWRPTSMREGIKMTLAWYLENEAHQEYHLQFSQVTTPAEMRLVRFENRWSNEAHVYWLKPDDGEAVSYLVLQAGEYDIVNSFVGHSFEVRRGGHFSKLKNHYTVLKDPDVPGKRGKGTTTFLIGDVIAEKKEEVAAQEEEDEYEDEYEDGEDDEEDEGHSEL